MITVIEVGDRENGGIPAAIARENRGATILLSKKTILPGPNNAAAWRVISKSPALPPEDTDVKVPDQISTQFFREIGPHVICVMLLNWDGDQQQANYQAIAAKMAASVQLAATDR